MSRTSALCAALLLIPALSVAAVIHVPGDEATIGGALLAASPYDTVLVAPGEYRVKLSMPLQGLWRLVLRIQRDDDLHEVRAETSVLSGEVASKMGMFAGTRKSRS